MYVCECCHNQMGPGERQYRVMVSARKVFHLQSQEKECEGLEPVKEVKCCDECRRVLHDKPLQIVGTKYIEFPRKESDLEKELPKNTIMAKLSISRRKRQKECLVEAMD